MLIAEDGSDLWPVDSSKFSELDWSADEFTEDLSMDMDALMNILDEPKEDSDGLPPCPGDLLPKYESHGVGNHENTQIHAGKPQVSRPPSIGVGIVSPGTVQTSYNSEASDSGTAVSGSSFNSSVNHNIMFDCNKQEHSVHTDSYVNDCSASPKDWISLRPGNGTCFNERAAVLVPTCSTSSSFAEGDTNNVSDLGDNFDVNILQGETELQLRHGVDVVPKYLSEYSGTENMDVDYGKHHALKGNTIESVGLPENNLCTSLEMTFMGADFSSGNVPSAESTICQGTDIRSEYSDMQYGLSLDDAVLAKSHLFPIIEETMTNIKDEIGEFPTESECSSNRMKDQGARNGTEMSMIDYPHAKGWNYGYEGNNYTSSIGFSSFDSNGYSMDRKGLTVPLTCSQSHMSSERKSIFLKDEEQDEMFGHGRIMEHSYSVDDTFFDQVKSSFSGVSYLSGQKTGCFTDEKDDIIVASNKAYHSRDNINGSVASTIDNGHFNLNAEVYFPCPQPLDSNENQPKCLGSHLSKVSPESTHSNFSEKSFVEDDSDVCIIEHMSHPAPSNRLPPLKNNLVTSQHCTLGDNYMGFGGMRLKARDESLILRQALQDLSQPKSEASPPDGVLTVPLLRHQKIALSWMVQKETANVHCAGGILADDQGLGKTISTIALILKERPPSFRPCQDIKCEMETLNLDEDEDEDVLPKISGMKQESDTRQVMPNGTPMKSMNSLPSGRPAAGTLVVCPTSVLRQWAEELHNKVSSIANLSVLVYHGSNRTRDPCELAKYDVVLTTYSIVSMEVPKQPLVDDDDEDKGEPEYHTYPTMGLSSSKKRKYPPSSDKKSSKEKKGLNGAVLESVARPLAKVGWFRVVLDEAQSIKNHRTQVARACWGLRAKRRWCLSGTPIQNAIDDLYSYFRFLKYEPYAIYKSFCSSIKVPINKNPSKGYKKLQAVLKTIMLRRTKGTLLDGRPIVTLPPKYIELKKVDFSQKERDFYSRLESDSRAQFEEYAAAGTVKQNYVNILLMLLRLRQACDHPLLVKNLDSHSSWRSSIDAAKKLSRDEQKHLLNCLEASLAICGICNDPPEDAVVSKCGHVFCKQCICEHLTGDDNQCPSTNCKIRLNVSLVFSKTTLNSALCDQQPKQDGSLECGGSEVVETVESSFDDIYDSSKIKAAIEVLQSLCKPQDCLSTNSSIQSTLDGKPSCAENSLESRGGEYSIEDIPDRHNLDVEKSSNNSVMVAGQKAIVFSQWTRMLDLLEACLKNSSIQYRRLDGTMSVLARDKAVKDFNTLPEVSVIIMSLKAASLGLNMVAACHVLLLDLWWNPTTEDQAIDRAHRIGQTRPVTVLRLTVRDTVEDRILALQQKKREMVASAFGEDETGGRQTRLTVEDLKYLFMM
ncbi:helicase-like transcription factor CHR28 isoform X2 [Ziziphus jujuba]|uniref:Helicase-like transcription factor CHR28 isoform X2 n=1 Tax=Ziziphus jujuba TaxID=326968 RepID=A0ABM3I8J1_ZIZJJ|nr:helicase-like transcription factor CHR28 isoform X2 [Ziziphus jujuba]